MRPGRLRFEANPRKKECETPSQQKKLSVRACACHPSYGGKYRKGGSHSRMAQAKSKRSYFKNNQSWVVVTHTCNPGYSGGSRFKASPGK
jgi:hypothetical protein